MYGHEFKELRLEQGITQKEACSGICSESKLSRWENDQVEVEFSTAMKLLNRIHITSHEFMGWSKFSPRPEIDPELSEATEKENIPFLKRVTQKQLTKYHKNHNKFDLLWLLIYVINFLSSNIKITCLLLTKKSFLQFFQKSIYGVNTIFQRLVHQFFYSILSKFMVVQCKSFVILTVLKKLKLVLT